MYHFQISQPLFTGFNSTGNDWNKSLKNMNTLNEGSKV